MKTKRTVLNFCFLLTNCIELNYFLKTIFPKRAIFNEKFESVSVVPIMSLFLSLDMLMFLYL